MASQLQPAQSRGDLRKTQLVMAGQRGLHRATETCEKPSSAVKTSDGTCGRWCLGENDLGGSLACPERVSPYQDFSISVDKALLLRLLGEGHHRLAAGEAHAPFLATGGIGRYIAMPLTFPKHQVQPVQPKQEENMNEVRTNIVAMPSIAATPEALLSAPGYRRSPSVPRLS